MKHKSSLTIAFAIAGLLFTVSSFGQIQIPIASPAGSVSGDVGLTTVSVNYFRPGVKGRIIFGEGGIVPFGSIWRTGANNGSKVTFSTDLKFGNQEVAAGDYLLFSVPGAEKWDVMLYSDLSIGGNTTGYDETNEVAKISVKPETLDNSVERLTFTLADVSSDNTMANLRLTWENTAVNMPITVSFDEAIMNEIATKTKVNPGNYLAGARYYMETGKDLDQALEWVNMYLAVGENSKQFWNTHLKAQILAAKGNSKEAIKVAEQSLAAAKANAGGAFGYDKRNEELIATLKKK
ncbi:MAG: DUF2911 domain-containing protein [Cyclobacteriaceae bacterium]